MDNPLGHLGASTDTRAALPRLKGSVLNRAEPPLAGPDEVLGDSGVERRLRAILEATSSLTGDDFFASLVRHLAAALDVRFAFVSQCTDETRTSVKTLALWSGSSFGENFRYAVEGTPCEPVMQNEASFVPRDAGSLFPRDRALQTLGVEGYLGVPALGSAGDVIGHLVVMDVNPLEPPRHSDWILKVFAARAGVEIERRQAERVQRRYAQRLKTLQGEVPQYCVVRLGVATTISCGPRSQLDSTHRGPRLEE